ncbi:MAG: BamA/TamA family outer membrane protein [candidate division Zixibacteria bacterium]|nr:BamA/TamA family outer membrane protein [candidate division Zixibacteria bacterium]
MKSLSIIFFGVLAILSGWFCHGLASPEFFEDQDSIEIRLDFLGSPKDDISFSIKTTTKRPKVGLALSGGGARGLAQIGILKVLEREKIPIDFIAGTSMGGILGGLYAAGYSTEELEKIAKDIDWNDLLTDTPPRLSLFLSQREEKEGSLFQFRLDGLKLYIPTALTSGQKLTNLFTNLTMRANLTSKWFQKPYLSFDNLKIPFRAVTTDLVTGERVILDSGDLAQSLKATMIIPLAFSPVESEDRLLVDGGLVDPIPVEVTKEMGADVVIAINTVSSLLPADKIKTPLDVANQATTIMSLRRQREELDKADYVITPDLSEFSSMDFARTAELITLGETTAESLIFEIKKAISQNKSQSLDQNSPEFKICELDFKGNQKIKTDFILELTNIRPESTVTIDQIQSDLEEIYACGFFADVYASLQNIGPEEHSLRFYVTENPPLKKIVFENNTIYPDSILNERINFHSTEILNYRILQQILDSTASVYHQDGYSLAHIEEVDYDSASGSLNMKINEGMISRIELSGNRRTRNWMVLRNFPQKAGESFNSRKVTSGISNIHNTGLFEKVNFSTHPTEEGMVLKLKVKEKKFNIVRIGAHYSDEYQTEGFLQFIDANVFGIGNRISTHLQYGERKQILRLNFKADRIFKTYLTYKLNIFYQRNRRKLFEDHHKIGDFSQQRVGANFSLGQHISRLGIISVETKAEKVKIDDGIFEDTYNIRSLIIRSLVDTFDKYPFPHEGKYHHLYVELAGDILGGDLVYRKAFTSLESYFPLHRRVNFHPRVAIGISDGTVPISEKFTLGGCDDFFGLFSEELKGDKMFVGSLGLRFKFFHRLYWTLRYDMGEVWSKLESIKLKNLKHGFGSSLALDTPLGPLEFAYGVATDEWDKFYFEFGFDF